MGKLDRYIGQSVLLAILAALAVGAATIALAGRDDGVRPVRVRVRR